ncbi:PTS sugar transporter subunit IIB [Lacrimispora algidixylanolytica]|uniref:PTS sugar transporter subunit IIB n=1 Tax=Lacrimispora algidixylanolytica TaxID=94868 RepID=A0A419SYW1_9FIRM|nr:PTS sugar transporter subunit IIB [Lacrimispora algidixylanolytica]RKD30396.1 PTS sugar transporter subunit IIB [Lacrimispora algidixylanolytica]
MKKLRVLLVCGSGASSGFMAANIRKAAKQKEIEMEVQARSDSEIDNYIEDVDLIMVGPHLEYVMDDLEEYTHEYPVKIALMKPEYYSRLDGAKAIEHILSLYE